MYGAWLDTVLCDYAGRILSVDIEATEEHIPPLPPAPTPSISSSSIAINSPRHFTGGRITLSRFTCKTKTFPSELPRTRTWNLEIKSLRW